MPPIEHPAHAQLERALENVLKHLHEHDERDHDGEQCLAEYSNAVAFLIVRLGLFDREGMARVGQQVGEYLAEQNANIRKN